MHCRYQRHSFDNGLVWGGNETIEIDGIIFGPTLARAYIEPGETSANARVCCQLFVAEIDPSAVKAEDIDARLWADVDGLGSYVDMWLVADRWGVPVLDGSNLVFESPAFPHRALPLFFSGVMDIQTGDDVRKGSLGSV